MRRLLAVAGSVVLVVALGAGAVVAARSFIGDESPSSPIPQASPTPTFEDRVKAVQEDQAKPPFVGDVLGIYVIGSEQPAEAPDQYATVEDVCGPAWTGASVAVDWAKAGELDLNFQLPPEYFLLPDDPNSGVVACAGTEAVYAARRMYQRKAGGEVIIGRGRGNVTYGMRVPADRVKVVSIGGRQAILLEPIYAENLANDIGTRTQVIFPEAFGQTFIHASGIPLTEVMKLADTVARAGQ